MSATIGDRTGLGKADSPGADLTASWHLQYLPQSNHNFSITDMLLITGIAAIAITLIMKVSIGGGLILFFCACLAWWSLIVWPKPPETIRFWNQFIWVVLMPLVCIMADPFVLGQFDYGVPLRLNSFALAVYVFLLWQALAISLSWFLPVEGRILNSFLAGTFYAGAAMSYLLGFVLIPFTVVMSFFGVGLLGFTPWFVGSVLRRSARMHLQRAKMKTKTGARIPLIGGFVLALLVGIAMQVANLMTELRIQRAFLDLFN